ncbi:bifunctional DNA primase/polymerase [Acrocarpospora catenulata]|uniref:bifunctional DNA primase/polymerase n=1 Tax=Acrocarpospora catenulata TaxID=2836182 RepID=UPI001BDA4575|nr:bifunctional DNA primase/polymerase [Acrocarpospora catenulata]
MPSPCDLIHSALTHIAQGIPVLPCTPGGKRPLGQLVPNGFHGASDDSELVSRWWQHCPNANVAIPTGQGSFDVLDVDVKPAGSGYAALNQLKAAGILPPPLAIIATPSGGLHCYYPGTAQTCGSLSSHFLDFKATGGYVLIPPSVVNGTAYRLIARPEGAGDQLNWSTVRQFLTPPRPRTATPTPRARPATGTGIPGLAAWLATQTKGNRNRGLFWACCRAVENGATETDLDTLVAAIVAQGLDQREARRTAADALRIARRTA